MLAYLQSQGFHNPKYTERQDSDKSNEKMSGKPYKKSFKLLASNLKLIHLIALES